MSNLEERSDALDEQMAKHPVEEAIKVLVKDANRRKRQLRILTISVIFDILLTLGLAAVSYKTNELAHLAQSNRQAVLANCEVSNNSRKDNRDLWDFAFALSPTQPLTDEQKAQQAVFKQFVNKTFAERNCQAEINKQ